MNETFTQRNFCEEDNARFNQCLQCEMWDLVYTQGTQNGFTWFKGFFKNKDIQLGTYTNRYPWMTNELRANILQKKIEQEF